MSQQNTSLTPYGYTYTDASEPNTTHSSASELIMADGVGGLHANSKIILQFDMSSLTSGSKINSAILNFGLQFWWSSSQTPTGTGGNARFYTSGAVASGYICDTVTHQNYSTLMTQGVRTLQKGIAYNTEYYQREIDITSIVANNISNNILTVVIDSVSGYQPQKILSSSISLALNYETVDPVAPVLVCPNGTYENKSNQIKFQWIYKSQTEATQASASLEYRLGSSGAYSGITVYSSNNYYDMAANTLSEGVYEWRVCTTDTDGQTSDYAYGSFAVIASPAVPIITSADNKCISTIYWSSASQVAFEIEIYKGNDLLFSKQVASSENHYKPNMFFTNTSYTVNLRVCNMYGLWSQWGSKTIIFSFTNPTKPTIAVSTSNNDIVIRCNTNGAMLYKSSDKDTYYPIAKFDDTLSYRDYNVASDKMYKYFVRNYADGYTDSDVQSGIISINGLIVQNDNYCVNGKHSSDPYMPFNENPSIEVAKNVYSGRTYPVAEFGEHKTRTLTRSFIVTSSEYEELKSLYMSATPVIYRDNRGILMYCIIDSINVKNEYLDTRYSIDLTVSQIDGTEEISVYD